MPIPPQQLFATSYLNELQVKGLGASVDLSDRRGGALHGEVRGGDGVDASGVALGGHGRRHGQLQAAIRGVGDRERLGRLVALALPWADLGQLAVDAAENRGLAGLGLRLHGTRLEDAELVANGASVSQKTVSS